MRYFNVIIGIFFFLTAVSPWARAEETPDAVATWPADWWIETCGDGLHEATCADGVVIRMRRYRPAPDAPFREGRQPVLIFPGILINTNEFLPSRHATPECSKRYANMELRTPIAQWAQGDPYVAADPMLYFNLGQYLWNQGYDAWFANYRGIGRGAYLSDRIEGDFVTLDSWITLDTPAAIDKVIAITGLKPFIGGHSTGGLVAYAYLQGTYVDAGELQAARAGGYNPHVRNDPELARQRNAMIRGIVGLDPAAIPPLPGWLDAAFFWNFVNDPRYVDIEKLMAALDVFLTGRGTTRLIRFLFDGFYGRSTGNQAYDGANEALNIWNTHDKHPCMNDWIAYHVFEKVYMSALGQYLDFNVSATVREHWQNGAENAGLRRPPAPAEGDGYYDYLDNMPLVTAPFIALLSQYDGLVSADEVIRDVMRGKTANPHDRWCVLPNTGHMNVQEGYVASTLGFPMIGEWLGQVGGGPASVVPLSR